MITWPQVRSLLGYLLTLALMVCTVIAVQSQSDEEEPSAEGRLRQYYSARRMDLYPGGPYPADDGLYPGEVYPGDWPPLYPGDEKWDGQYQPSSTSYHDREIRALTSDGQYIYIGGQNLHPYLYPVERWKDNTWSMISPGMNGQIYGTVNTMLTENNELYIGGTVNYAGGVTVSNAAHWNGTTWDNLGGGFDGEVTRMALSSGNLYAVGSFTTAGGAPANHAAYWDGKIWKSMGTGIDGNPQTVTASGSDVYVGGFFTSAGGQPANNIAHWDGLSWSALGSGLDGTVYAIAVSGSSIYAGGSFTNAGGKIVNGIARWDGAEWQPMGSGLAPNVLSILIAPEGIYAGGDFHVVMGQYSANSIAFWDGAQWNYLGSGTGWTGNYDGVGGWVGGPVNDILLSGNQLFAGGKFWSIGNNASNGFAIWNKQPAVETYQLGNTPVAPGSIIYLFAKWFPAHAKVELLIDGQWIYQNLQADADGKVYVRLATGATSPSREYKYTFTMTGGVYQPSGGSLPSASGSFILDEKAKLYRTVWTGGTTAVFTDLYLHLPVIQR